ncbi:zinc finger MYM-type protein 1-like [Rosa sericea]
MLRYFKRKENPCAEESSGINTSLESSPAKKTKKNDSNSEKSCPEVNEKYPSDPGNRPLISSYHPNVQDEVRRYYLQKGPCQPRAHEFPITEFGRKKRRFVKEWFDDFPTWLEYSIKNDAAYCLCCYLFKQGGGDAFVGDGFKNWKKKSLVYGHVGGPNSTHNKAQRNCEALLSQKQHIETILSNHTSQDRIDYRIRLSASIGVVRILLKQGLPFRGHDESENSNNRGNFLEILEWLCGYNEDIKAVTLKNAPENLKLTSPDIQKDIVSAISVEVVNRIASELGDSLFAILVDESRDMSSKEQMAIVLRYVDGGNVIERFVGIEHVMNTNAITLKEAIDDFLSRHGLSISRLRGQGYDGASNMRGELNGLKTLILNENKCAFYVHCFAHQLQLALVAVAKNHDLVSDFFTLVANVVNVVGASAKRRDILREKHGDDILEALENNELSSGQGLNQETSVKRTSDTRWSSHYDTLISLARMFKSVIAVLEVVRMDGTSSEQKLEARVLLDYMRSYEFIFCLHLMRKVLGITNDLSKALQKKDQDIVNAMNLVTVCKERLQAMRESGWDSLLTQITLFCEKHSIKVPNMDECFAAQGKSKRNAQVITNLHHYRVQLFYTVIDNQLQELDDRFNEKNIELLLCMSCLNPRNSFSAFDKEKLIKLAQYYPQDFSAHDLEVLDDQLENYIVDMRSNIEFSELKGITDLAQKMVQKKKDVTYPLVYLLLTLALILPVATASVERVFSAMNIVKTRLRSRMGDEFMNDCLISYIEKDIFTSIDDETIMQRFQNMKSRRGQLPL